MESSYVHVVGRVRLTGETIGQRFAHTVDRFGDREALVSPEQGYRATYAELHEQTGRLGRALMARGIERGDRVGIWAPNRFEWVLMQFAAARVGAILVNISTGLRRDDLAHVLQYADVKLLAYASGFRTIEYGPLLAAVRDTLPGLEVEVPIDTGWAELLAAGDAVSPEALDARERGVQSDDPCNMQFTSGTTTGMPKAVLLSHHTLLNNALSLADGLDLSESDRLCNPMPFHHSFGMACGTLACLSTGAAVVIPGPAFDPVQVLRTVADERCTALYGVPTMFIAELGVPDFDRYDISSLRVGVMGGAPCPVEVMKKLESQLHMRNVLVIFGQTEGGGPLTMTRARDSITQRTETVGTVLDNMELKIADPETASVTPIGTPGEICTRGFSTMTEYWRNPEATELAIDQAGWLHTGDLGVMDDDGYVAVVGRIKDMIIRGGQNIYPREVEEFLHGHPDIDDVYVVGVPHERYGEEVAACVRLRAGATVTGEELQLYCRERIATYKVPVHWQFVDDFPVTASGKVQKFRLRDAIVERLAPAQVPSA